MLVIWDAIAFIYYYVTVMSPTKSWEPVKFWISRISGGGGPIDTGRRDVSRYKGVGPIMWPWAMPLTLDFQCRVLKKKSVSQEWEGRLTWKERIVWVDRKSSPLFDLELWLWPWIFKVKLKRKKKERKRIRGMAWPVDMWNEGGVSR